MQNNFKKKVLIFAVAAVLCCLIVISMASAAVGVDSTELRDAVTVENITDHLTWLQSNGPRVSGTPGYVDASDYVAQVLSIAGISCNLSAILF